MSSSYERIDSDNINSAPVLRDEPESYSSGEKGGFRRTFDTNLPQHVEARFDALRTTITETSTKETEEQPKQKSKDRKLSSRSGLTGLFKSNQFIKAGQRGTQTPPRVAEERPGEIAAMTRPAEATRIETDASECDTTSSTGANFHNAELREQRSQVESTWSYSSQGNMEEQRTTEHVSLETTAAEDEEPKKADTSLSRQSLSRSRSLGKKSSKSLRGEVEKAEGFQESLMSGSDEEEAKSGRQRRQREWGEAESGHDRIEFGGHNNEFSESRQSTNQRSVESQPLGRPLQRSSTEVWSTESRSIDRQPLQRWSTEQWSTEGQQPPRVTAVGAIEEGKGQRGIEKGWDSSSSRLLVKKGDGKGDGKVGRTANPKPMPVTGTNLGCIQKPVSALMLTLSEGVDLSSNFEGHQEDPQSSFGSSGDDRDSPSSHEKFPLESLVQEHVPNLFSFVSSPVISPTAVDIYEEFPALSQNNLPSPYSLRSISPTSRDTASDEVPVHDKEIPFIPLSDLSTDISAEVSENLPPLLQTGELFHKVLFPTLQGTESPTIRAGVLSLPNVTPDVQEDRSLSSENNTSTFPTNNAYQSSTLPLSDLPINILPEISEELSPPSRIGRSFFTRMQKLFVNPEFPEDPSTIPEETSVLPVLESQPIPQTPLNESPEYPLADVLGDMMPEAKISSLVIRAQASSVIPIEALPSTPNDLVFIPENISTPPTLGNSRDSTQIYHAVPEGQYPVPTRLSLPSITSNAGSFSPSIALPAVTEDIVVLPISSIGLQRSSGEEFSDRFRAPPENPSPSLDSLPIVQRDILTPPKTSIGGFQQPTTVFTLSHQSGSQAPPPPFGSRSSLSSSSRSSPHLTGADPQLHSLSIKPEISRPRLPRLDTILSYKDEENLPVLPPSGPCSPAVLMSTPVSPIVFPEWSLESLSPNVLVSHPISQEVLANIPELASRNHSSPSIGMAEPMVEILHSLPRPSSSRLQPGHLLTYDLPEAQVGLSPVVDGLARSVISMPPPITVDDRSSTDVSLSNPASPSLWATDLDNLPQLPASDPSSPYDLPQTPLRPLSPMRELTLGGPLVSVAEHEFVAVIDRVSPTTNASVLDDTQGKLPSEQSPTDSEKQWENFYDSHPPVIEPETAPPIGQFPVPLTTTIPNGFPEPLQNKPLLAFEYQPSGVEYQFPPAADLGKIIESPLSTNPESFTQFSEAYSPTTSMPGAVFLSPITSGSLVKVEAEHFVLPDFSFEQPGEYELQQDISISKPSHEDIIPQESETENVTSRASVEAPSSSEDALPLISVSAEVSSPSHDVVAEPTITEAPTQASSPVGPEPVNPQLPLVPKIAEDWLPKLEGLTLSKGVSIASTGFLVRSEVAETSLVPPISPTSLGHTDLVESTAESVQLDIETANSAPKLGNLFSLATPPSVSVESLAVGSEETEFLFAIANITDTPIGPATEEPVTRICLPEEEELKKPAYQLPIVEVEVRREFSQFQSFLTDCQTIVPVEIEVEETVENSEPTATGSIFRVEEEEALGKGSAKGENGRSKEIVSDWEFVGAGVSSPEGPYVLPAARNPIADRVSRQEVSLDDGQNIKGSFPLTEEKEREIDAQGGADLEPRTVVQEVKVREESASKEERKPGVEIRKSIPEQLIPYPIFPTYQQPADQMEFPILTIEPTTLAPDEAEAVETTTIDSESQQIGSEVDVQEEGVILELSEEDPMEEDFISSEERESIFEYFGLESTEITATPQPVLVSPNSEHFEQVVDHIELLPPTIGPNYIPDTEAGVEIATLKPHSQHRAQPEEPKVDGWEGIILEERVSTGEELVKDEGIFEHEEIRQPVSAEQGSLEDSLASPDLDCSEDQLDPPSSAIILPETGTEVTENHGLKPELGQDLMLKQLEHKQSQENNSEMPKSPVSSVFFTIEQQPKPEPLANPISRSQVKIEDIEIATSVPEQVLPEQTKWEERHETALEHPESFMLVQKSPVLESLVESPSSTLGSVHILDSESPVRDPTNTRSEPEPDFAREEKEEGLKEPVREQIESFKAISPSPTSANQSTVSPPQIKSELVGIESEDIPYGPETPKRNKSGKMKEEEKGQPISM